jgi:hypothetical protein
MYPGLKDTTGGPEKVRKRLTEVLPKVWDSIEPEFFESLWRSMPSRVCAIIAAKGWYTKY